MLDRRKAIIAVLICVSTAVGIVADYFNPGEPQYNGKKLSAWLASYQKQYNTTQAIDAEAETAVRAIGTNALPFLLEWSRYDPPDPWGPLGDLRRFLYNKLGSFPPSIVPRGLIELVDPRENWKLTRAESTYYGFRILEATAEAAIPELARMSSASVGWSAPRRAAQSLARIGTAALPAILTVMTNENALGQEAAVSAVLRLGTNATPAYPTLISLMQDRSSRAALSAAYAVWDLCPEPEMKFTALTNLLNSPSAGARFRGVERLAQFDNPPQPVLPFLLRLLADSDQKVRIVVTNAFLKIAPEVFTNSVAGSENTISN